MATKLVNVETIGSYFESLSDPRHTRNRKHLLVDVVVIAVCGILCGSDGPTAIHRWADNRRDWLDQFLSLPNGCTFRNFLTGDCPKRREIRGPWALMPLAEGLTRCWKLADPSKSRVKPRNRP